MSFPLGCSLEEFEVAASSSDTFSQLLIHSSAATEAERIKKLECVAKELNTFSLCAGEIFGSVLHFLRPERRIVGRCARTIETLLFNKIVSLLEHEKSTESGTEMNLALFLLVHYFKKQEAFYEAKFNEHKGQHDEAAVEWAPYKLQLLRFLLSELLPKLTEFYGTGFIEQKAHEFIFSIVADCALRKWNLKASSSRALCIDDIRLALADLIAFRLESESTTAVTARILAHLLGEQPLLKDVLLPVCVSLLEQSDGACVIIFLYQLVAALLDRPLAESANKQITDPQGQAIVQFLTDLAQDEPAIVCPFLNDLQVTAWQGKSTVRRSYMDLLGAAVRSVPQQNFNAAIAEFLFSRLKDKDFMIRSKAIDQFIELYDLQPSAIELFPVIFSAVMSRAADRVKRVRLQAYKALIVLLENNPYGRSLLPETAKERLEQVYRSSEPTKEELVKKLQAADHFIRGVLYGKLMPQLYRTLLRRSESDDYCEEEVRAIGDILALKIDGVISFTHDWHRLLDTLVHPNAAVEFVLGNILTARLTGDSSADLEFLAKIMNDLPDTHMEILDRLVMAVCEAHNFSSVVERALKTILKPHKCDVTVHTAAVKVVWLLAPVANETQPAFTDVLPKYLRFTVLPEVAAVEGAKYCLKALLRAEISSSVVPLTLIEAAATLGCVKEAVEHAAKPPHAKQRLVELCQHLEAKFVSDTAVATFLQAVAHSVQLLGSEIGCYWDQQFNDQIQSTAGQQAAEEDYLTCSRTREEVLRLAAAEKDELVTDEESYFSRFPHFALRLVLDQDAPLRIRSAAAEALSSFARVSPSLAAECLPSVLQQLSEGEPSYVLHAELLADLIVALPDRSELLFEHIVSALKHPHVEVRKAAVIIASAVLLKRLVKHHGKLALMAECYVDEDVEIRYHCHHFFHELVRVEKLDVTALLFSTFLSMEPENRRAVISNLLAIFSGDIKGDLSLMFVQSLIDDNDPDKAFVLSHLTPSSKSLAALQEALQRNVIDTDDADLKEGLVDHLRRGLHKKGKEKQIALDLLKFIEGRKRAKRNSKVSKMTVTMEALNDLKRAPKLLDEQLLELSELERTVPQPSAQRMAASAPQAKSNVVVARKRRR